MDLKEFLDEIGIEPSRIIDFVQYTSRHYREFLIRKKSGGVRRISAPCPELMELQRFILKVVLYKIPVSDAAKGYVRRRSVRSNARLHKAQSVVVKFDISEFFGSIRQAAIADCLFRNGIEPSLADFIAGICTLDGVLPQGAPASGCLSNLIMKDFDDVLLKYVKKNGVRYSRYSDDLTFSGDQINIKALSEIVEKELSNLGLKSNNKKFRILLNNIHRQVVTGVVVNKELSPGRNFLRDLRQEVHYIIMLGAKVHSDRRGYKNEVECLSSVLGKVAYAKSICRHNEELEGWQKYLLGLNSYVASVRSRNPIETAVRGQRPFSV